MAQERARQALLAAQARARLAAQAAARAQAQAAARAQAQAASPRSVRRPPPRPARRRPRLRLPLRRSNEPNAWSPRRRRDEHLARRHDPERRRSPGRRDPDDEPAARDEHRAGRRGEPAGHDDRPDAPGGGGRRRPPRRAPPRRYPLLPSEPLPAGYPEAASIALQYLGVPYLWGGESTSGFDCSGLVSYVYAQLGVSLPHFAAAQYTYGVPVPQSELEPGDLVFFDNLGHVGIYIGDGQFVDAPHTGSFVRIDTLGEPWYASHYVGARRI